MTRLEPRARQPSRRVLSPLRDFLATETAGGVLLAVAAVAALVLANSPWSGAYERFWSTAVDLPIGDHSIDLLVREWVNEGLITIFFFVVGLEIKRELVSGQLATRRGALLPVAAALGGMVAPALIYLAIAGGNAPRGWAIVVATDIPLALGVLAIAGSRVPAPLRVFILALAIVDDIGSLLIVAAFYSTGIGWGWLAGALVIFALAALGRRIGLPYNWLFLVLGCALWFALHEAGVNATLAGVAMALLAPSTPPVKGGGSVVESLEHTLHPWSSYVIIPVFALANTGIALSADIIHAAVRSPITWAIVVARVIGKPVGILVVTRSVCAAGLADPPDDSGTRRLVGVATSAGMGFTVALFITELAFTDETSRSNATLGIVVAAVIAALASLTILSAGGAPQ